MDAYYRENINSDTLEERVDRITPGFPYMTSQYDLHTCPNNTFPWHWHKEVEFFYMVDGELEYNLPGGTYHFGKGEGGFVNSNVLHMVRTWDKCECMQLEHIFSPAFISGHRGSVMETKYILPITQSKSLDVFQFNVENPEHLKLIEYMNEAHLVEEKREPGYEFEIRALMSKMWMELFVLTKEYQQGRQKPNLDDERIKQMMSYVAVHYGDKMELKDIADSAFIGERECFRSFKRNLNMTPFEYVIDYRITKACELLRSSGESILDISNICGFSSNSYFGKVFKEKIGCTPKEFRREG